MDREIVICCKIQGKNPMMLNRFTDEAQMDATDMTRTSVIGDRGTPKEQAEKGLYKDEKGNLIIPTQNIFSMMISGGKFFKAGKSKVTTQKTSLIPACVTMLEPYVPLVSREGWMVDQRPVRNPSTGGRFLCYRPMFNDWEFGWKMALDSSLMSEKLLREIVDICGVRIGWGEYRPECKGPYGKFVVIEWKSEKNGAK